MQRGATNLDTPLLELLSYLVVIALQADIGSPLQMTCTQPLTASDTPLLPAGLNASVRAHEGDGWAVYQVCQRGSSDAVVLLNPARSKHLHRGEAPGPPNNLVIASRRSRRGEELTADSRFIESSGDVGVCMVTILVRSFVLYECDSGDGPSSSREIHALRW